VALHSALPGSGGGDPEYTEGLRRLREQLRRSDEAKAIKDPLLAPRSAAGVEMTVAAGLVGPRGWDRNLGLATGEKSSSFGA
jgi:hypothetical protein